MHNQQMEKLRLQKLQSNLNVLDTYIKTLKNKIQVQEKELGNLHQSKVMLNQDLNQKRVEVKKNTTRVELEESQQLICFYKGG